ncbi:methyl-accepting chemotaxis protein [Herbaspirillum rhizosphaerae]|uniref:Methyl-accepting chemotaxis protein n=1 Tax=Herbaspirillum rhizosphaerae TaxID=346179 RepID=A0ABW8Z1N5_9BURK
MISSIRTKILLIAAGTVIFSLALTSGVIYALVRADNLDTIRHHLESLTSANALAVAEWSNAKAVAVAATAAEVDSGDPRAIVQSLLKSGGFSLTTAGWQDKSFISSTLGLPADYDPTTRPWYKESIREKTSLITKPYRSATGVVLVSFTAPVLRNGKVEGVVAGGVSLEKVRDVIAAIHPTPSSIGFVVDKEGTVIAHPDEKLLLKPATEWLTSLTPDALKSMATNADVMEADVDGAAKLLRAKSIPGTDWVLIVSLDRHEATAGMRSVLNASVIALVLLAALATLLSSVLTARSFRRLSEARDAMDEIGSGTGDLTRRLPVVGHDEVAQIATSFNTFVEKIADVLKQIRDGSESVSMATSDIESGNRDLSYRTEMAAGNLQETSASLEQLTGSVDQSAEASTQVARLAKAASESALTGHEVMAGVVATMNDIARSSANIVNIISVIDGIAFQTNILALNASVEAARAGENGRGFAVVASEVRNLAQRSAAAAKEIKSLITVSEASVRSGSARVQEAGRNMVEIVDGIQRVADIVNEINVSMREQSQGIGQINLAVAEMDHSTQQNAALVEQAAAASITLKQEAARLNQLVASFKLDSEPEEATIAPVRAPSMKTLPDRRPAMLAIQQS